jgi:hypothetical protein
MVKAGRSPRRGYNADGTMIQPATVGQQLAFGYRMARVFCHAVGCHADWTVPLDRFSPDLPLPDIALHLRCIQCGSAELMIHVNVEELYAMSWGGQGYSGQG